MFADGSIVEDYEPLFAYWEIASKKSREIAEKAMLRNEDFEYLKSIVGEGGISLYDLLEAMTSFYYNRVDEEIAAEAFRRVLELNLEPETARRRIARILAGWITEAACHWNMIRLKKRGTR